MTADGSRPPEGGRIDGETSKQRDERLAALLSVDLSAAVEEHAARRRRGTAVVEGTVEAAPTSSTSATTDEEPASDADRPVRTRRTWSTWQVPTWQVAVSFVVLGVLLVSGVGLAYAGTRLIRSSTEGEVFTPVDDPAAPGFEALVDSTPTLVMLHERQGLLDAITVLTLPDPESGGGGVLLIPDRTVAELPAFGDIPIEAGYDLVDAQFEAQAVGDLLGAAMGETEVVDAERWSDLVEPVAPITVDNPNQLAVDGEVRFPIGEIDLEAEDVGPYLEADDAQESDLARMVRHERFWEAWLDAVAEDGSPSAVPGELESGIGRFVRTISGGPAVIETLPVRGVPDDRYGEEPAYLPVGAEVEELVSRIVPFPVSPSPGARARLRLLNGTTDTSRAASVAADLTAADVEIVLIGNASSLDHEATTVRYVGDEFRDEALEVVEILGVGEVVEDARPSDAADITVTLGADYG